MIKLALKCLLCWDLSFQTHFLSNLLSPLILLQLQFTRKRRHFAFSIIRYENKPVKPTESVISLLSRDSVVPKYLIFVYSEPSLQRLHSFTKMLLLKCCCKESLMDRMVCKKKHCFILISSQNICFGYLLE